MVTKRRSRTQRETPGEIPDETPATEEAAETGNLFDPREMKDDDYVRIQRRDDTEKTMVYHGRLAPNESQADKVAELFGGGFYRVQWFQRNPEGQYFIKGTRTFKIPGPYKPPAELPGVGTAAKAASSVNGSIKPEVGTFGGNAGEALNSALVASVIDLMKSLREKPPQQQQAPTVEWGPIITAITGMLGPLLLKLVERPSAPDMRTEVLAVIKEMKDMVPANNPASNAISDAVKGLKELMGLKDIVEGKEAPPDPETAMWAMGAKALDVLAAKANGPAPQPERRTVPGAAPQLPADTPMWRRLLLSQKRQLLQAAAANLNPATAAELALTYLPPTMNGVLAEFLTLPDHLELACQTIPELRQFPHWSADFFQELAAQFSETDEEREDADTATGETSTEG